MTLTQSTLTLLKETKRYKPISIEFLGRKIKIVDSASFLSAYQEIFEKQTLRFTTKRHKPSIIDCGANIGLSILFFKSLYPQSNIIAFEPVPGICDVLQSNLNQFGYNDVTVHNKGVWNKATRIPFMNEGADGGRIAIEGDMERIIEVETVQLSNFINDTVDFLKIDIEGAEAEVIQDIRSKLHFVQNIFVEYHSFANKQQSLDVILTILHKNGFRFYIHSGFTSPQPFLEVRTHWGMDQRLHIFACKEGIRDNAYRS